MEVKQLRVGDIITLDDHENPCKVVGTSRNKDGQMFYHITEEGKAGIFSIYIEDNSTDAFSTNCRKCYSNKSTDTDMLCDSCREERNQKEG